MTQTEFNKLLSATLGYGYIRKFTELAGMSHSQISRYANGRTDIPRHIALLVRMLPVVIQAGRTDLIPDWERINAPKRSTRQTS